jgi:16S rRNA (cytosine967-C5)-methyltransferase
LSISPARQCAFRILKKVLLENGYAAELLHSESNKTLIDEDKRLATELVFGVLRHKSMLDWILSAHSQRDLCKLDPEVLLSLRLGAYQICLLSKVPPHAVVHDAVEIVKKSKLMSAAGYVNAILRKLDRRQVQTQIDQLSLDSISGLSIRYSHPEWLVARWAKNFGLQPTRRLLEHNNTHPSVFFRLSSPQFSNTSLIQKLSETGVKVRPHGFSHEILELIEGDLQKTEVFENHAIYIQDSGSQLIPRLLSPGLGDRCLDLCAGTGGKASLIAQLQAGRGFIQAVDLHWRRLQLGRQLHESNWPCIHWVTADATRPLPFSILFDKILLDAPCSGTGTLQRRPEIRWRLNETRLANLQELQVALLRNAMKSLKPGGLLIYSTCSLEPEENEQVVEKLIGSQAGYCLEIPTDEQLKPLFAASPFMHLFPPHSNSDGFFAALIRKNESPPRNRAN